MRASIDIGTNTALLLIAEQERGSIKVIHEEQRVPRLGKGVDQAKQLSDEAIDRVIQSLSEFQQIILRDFPSVKNITVTATSAVRDAENKAKFLDTVEDKTGLRVQVLSGFEEANHTFRGAKSELKHLNNEQCVVIDIGGGSTEIATGNKQVRDRYSFNMGCVRFTERFLRDDPPAKFQLAKCRESIRHMLQEYEFNFVDNTTLIGVAGTVTSLAYIDKDMNTYESKKLTGYKITRETLSSYIDRFSNVSIQQLIDRYPVVMKGRADIFLAGLLILEEAMIKYDFSNIITSAGGIRHGVILDSK